MLEFSRKLRIYIAENNIKKKNLAIELGVDPNTISNWIYNKVRISYAHALALDSFTKGEINMRDMGYET